MERIRWQGRWFAGVVAIAVEILARRRSQWTGYVEVRRGVLLREHLRYAESFSLSYTSVDLAEFASENVLDVGDALGGT